MKIIRLFEPDKRPTVELDESDGKGNITKALFYDVDGNLDETELYKYDEKGNSTEFVTYNGSGKLLFKETYTYEFDSCGNWTTERNESWSADPGLGVQPKTTITRQLLTTNGGCRTLATDSLSVAVVES